MKNLLLCVSVLVFVCYSSLAQDDNRGYIVKIGDMAPDFEMRLLDSSTIKLSDLQGKIVMLQFTASWCSVCRKEMPYIEREIWQILKDRPDFALYAIDKEESKETVEKYIKTTKISYPVGLDPLAQIFGLYAEENAGITRNVILDKSGKIVYLTRLFNQEEFEGMKEKIFQLLEEK